MQDNIFLLFKIIFCLSKLNKNICKKISSIKIYGRKKLSFRFHRIYITADSKILPICYNFLFHLIVLLRCKLLVLPRYCGEISRDAAEICSHVNENKIAVNKRTK